MLFMNTLLTERPLFLQLRLVGNIHDGLENLRLDFKVDQQKKKIKTVVVNNMEPRLQKFCSNATKVTPAENFWWHSVPRVRVVCVLGSS